MLWTSSLHHFRQHYHAATRRHLEPDNRSRRQTLSLRHLAHHRSLAYIALSHSGLRNLRANVFVESFDLEFNYSYNFTALVCWIIGTLVGSGSVGNLNNNCGIVNLCTASALPVTVY